MTTTLTASQAGRVFSGDVLVNTPGIVLKDCQFKAGPTAEGAAHLTLGSLAADFVADTCEFDGTAYKAVLSRAKNVTLQKLHILGSGQNLVTSPNSFYSYGIHRDRGAGYFRVINCRIENTGGHGVYINGAFAAGDSVQVDGCTMLRCGQAGFSAYKTRAPLGVTVGGIVSGCLVEGCNRLAGTPGAGGNASGGVHFNNEEFAQLDPANPFIAWTARANKVRGCVGPLLQPCEEGGIAVDYGAHGVLCEGNMLIGNWPKGGYSFNAKGTIWRKNIFAGNDTGLCISCDGAPESCKGVVVEDNWFLGNWSPDVRGPKYKAEIVLLRAESPWIGKNHYFMADRWIRDMGGNTGVVQSGNADLTQPVVALPISVQGVVMQGNAIIGDIEMRPSVR